MGGQNPPEALPQLPTEADNRNPLPSANPDLWRYRSNLQEWANSTGNEGLKTLIIFAADLQDFERTLQTCLEKARRLRYIKFNTAILSGDEPNPIFTWLVVELLRILRNWNRVEVMASREHELSLELLNISIADPHRADPPIDLMHRQGELKFDPRWIQEGIGGDVTPLGLPIVWVVTHFRSRHWSHWQIGYEALGLLFTAFPRLSIVRLETEKPRNEESMLRQLQALTVQLPLWPSWIRTLNFHHVAKPGWRRLPEARESSVEMVAALQDLAEVLARRSFQLERLALCNFIGAELFFERSLFLQPQFPDSWTKLLHLTLTANNFDPTKPVSGIDSLLESAMRAASRMPVLELMELLKVGPRSAAMLQYDRYWKPRHARLSWMGTWEYNIKQFVIDNWKEGSPGRSVVTSSTIVQDRSSIFRRMRTMKAFRLDVQELLIDYS